MSFAEESDRRRKSEHPSTAGEEGSTPKKKRGRTPEVGHALRAAYQQTVNEDIPPEMLDLLGKLG